MWLMKLLFKVKLRASEEVVDVAAVPCTDTT